MTAPRMRVGVVGNEPVGHLMADGLSATGHTVVPLRSLADAAGVELVILAVSTPQLPRVVEQLAPHIRRSQIVWHTVLGKGAQALDDVETRGAVVIAGAPVTGMNTGLVPGMSVSEEPVPERWVVTALDELGETIAGLVVGELGGMVTVRTDAERPVLAAYVNYAWMSARVAAHAHAAMAELGLLEDAPALDTGLVEPSASDIIAGHAVLEDPGMRRAYLDVTRRYAEVTAETGEPGAEELEMWALQEETR
ncbi:hypothetical protein H0194_04055 [Corynebacterium incognita]|uniref:Putative oxidoreductase/dehydrogenase Rossmann-like domain-containing protein n=1 Tax=Corynebacterium incognita TaxID=2754725 RepID=A0A7G7CRF0_9CORY|nr:hypothetical protein [Corynebacterium incognita]QNE90166.1 hypothetical protein H0194_04055 [Corynebacterium incognita]